jgi:hypothetical protein
MLRNMRTTNVFFWVNLQYSQISDHPYEDLTNFG